jgi:hypothetical protein
MLRHLPKLGHPDFAPRSLASDLKKLPCQAHRDRFGENCCEPFPAA